MVKPGMESEQKCKRTDYPALLHIYENSKNPLEHFCPKIKKEKNTEKAALIQVLPYC